MYRIRAALFGLLLTLVASDLAAQSMTIRRALPNDVAELEARQAELNEILPAYGERANAANQAEAANRRDRLVGELDSTRVGPFTVIAVRSELEDATTLVERSWSHLSPLLNRHQDFFEGQKVLVRPRDGREFPPEYFEGDRSERAVQFRLDPPDRALQENGWPAMGAVQQATNRALRGELLTRMEGGGIAVDTDPTRLWMELARSRTPSGGACLQGSTRDCVIALGLVPNAERTAGLTDAFTMARLWYGLEDRLALVDHLAGNSRLRGDARVLFFDDRIFVEEVRGCLSGESQQFRSPQVAGNENYSCTNILSEFNPRFMGVSVPRDAFRSLVNHAIQIAPPGALARLREADGSVESDLEAAAGMSIDALVDDWRATYLGDDLAESGGPGSHHAPLALFWTGLFVTFSFLSTRRRFG